MADRYEAKIDDFFIDVETIDDGFENAIARHDYPYRNGAELENMGQMARTLRIRCYWLEDRYAEHYDFLEHLKSHELFELNHPKYGLINGFIESVMVRHDDRQEIAEVDISFIEDLLSQEKQILHMDVQAEAEESFTTGQQELMDSFADQARTALGRAAGGILAVDLDSGFGIVEQFSGETATARSWLKKVETFVTTIQAEANDIANPANSLLAMIDYGAQLPGRVIGALARTMERYAVLHDSLKEAPQRYFQNLQNSIDELVNQSGEFIGITKVAAAHRTALEAAAIYSDDETVRNSQRRKETASGSFDIAGNYLGTETVETVLTVRQLEESLATVRSLIQEGIDADRSQESLKTMAARLLEHVMVIKLERDSLVKIELDNPMSLHLVCLMRGLPYAYAERILAVNEIANPNFTDGEIDVYVR